MIEGLLYWLVTLIPELTFPLAFTTAILEAVEYVYWANYYLPIDTVALCFSLYYLYQVSLYMIKFLIHSLDKVI